MQDQNLPNDSGNLIVSVEKKKSYKKYIILLILIVLAIFIAIKLKEEYSNSGKRSLISPTPIKKPAVSKDTRSYYKSTKYNYTIILPKNWVQTKDLNIENLGTISKFLNDNQKQSFNKYLSFVDMMFVDPKSDNLFKNRLYIRIKDKKTYILKNIIDEDKELLNSFNKVDFIKDEALNVFDKKKYEIEVKMGLALTSFHGKSIFFENNDFIFVITGISFEEKWQKGFEKIFNQIVSTFVI
ncbi:MAG: hypothetical protein HYW86_00255 [Candidatus Roizmanbacteria bacterium]|nr:MAG: hypothetical protein HYW86_00255 [Candidatus Roizmanbacteria bacterium]